jgi:hypothetical protein
MKQLRFSEVMAVQFLCMTVKIRRLMELASGKFNRWNEIFRLMAGNTVINKMKNEDNREELKRFLI